MNHHPTIPQRSALARVYRLLIELAEQNETADSGQAGGKTESAAGKPPARKPVDQ